MMDGNGLTGYLRWVDPAFVFWAAVFETSALRRLLEPCISPSSRRPALLFSLWFSSTKGWPRHSRKQLRTCLQPLQEYPPRPILSRMPPALPPAEDVYVPWPDTLGVAALTRRMPSAQPYPTSWERKCRIRLVSRTCNRWQHTGRPKNRR
jgi:hypothetical protein